MKRSYRYRVYRLLEFGLPVSGYPAGYHLGWMEMGILVCKKRKIIRYFYFPDQTDYFKMPIVFREVEYNRAKLKHIESEVMCDFLYEISTLDELYSKFLEDYFEYFL